MKNLEVIALLILVFNFTRLGRKKPQAERVSLALDN